MGTGEPVEPTSQPEFEKPPAAPESRRRFLKAYACVEAAAIAVAFGVLSNAVGRVIDIDPSRPGWAPWLAIGSCLLAGMALIRMRWKRWKQIWEHARPTVLDPGEVFKDEREVLGRRRQAANVPPGEDYLGIALSGGGIRSASVSLGFLKELDRVGLLRRADYLSTVSGGGWAGGAYTLSARAPDAEGLTAPWEKLAGHFQSHGSGFLAGTLGSKLRLGVFLGGYFLWSALISVATLGALGTLALAALALLPLGMPTGFFGQPEPLFANTFLYSVLDYTSAAADDVGLGEALVPFSWQKTIFAAGLGLLGVGWWLDPSRRQAHQGEDDDGRSEVGIVCQRGGGIALTIALAAFSLSSQVHWKNWWLAGLVAGLLAAVAVRASSRRAGAVLSIGVFAAVLAGALVLERTVGLGCFRPIGVLADLVVGAFELTGGSQVPILEAQLSGSCAPTLHRVNPAHSYDGVRVVETLVLIGVAMLALIYFFGALDRRLAPSLHEWWGQRITQGFLAGGGVRDPASMFSKAGAPTAPLHLINAAFDARSSLLPWLRKVGVGQFVFGPVLTGGKHVGWTDSAYYASHIDYAGAIAVSAAAINALGGRAIPRWTSRFLSVLQVRQGRWVPNPTRKNAAQAHPLSSFLRELFGRLDETVPHLHVSDGGHEENLGLATLVERGCRTVLVLDAAHDPDAEFSDFGFCCRRLRWKPVDELSGAKPTATLEGQKRLRVSKEAVFAFTKKYRGQRIRVLYAKLALTEDMWAELRERTKWEVCFLPGDAFPQDPTRDQLFEPERVAAYQEVGRLLARRLLKSFGKDLGLEGEH